MFVSETSLNLSIEPGSDPIRGHLVREEDERPVEFTGWVELANAIEEVRSGAERVRGQSLGWVPGAEGPEDVYLDDIE